MSSASTARTSRAIGVAGGQNGGRDAKPEDDRVRLAGDIPTGDSPEPPEEKPALERGESKLLDD